MQHNEEQFYLQRKRPATDSWSDFNSSRSSVSITSLAKSEKNLSESSVDFERPAEVAIATVLTSTVDCRIHEESAGRWMKQTQTTEYTPHKFSRLVGKVFVKHSVFA